MEWGRWDRDAVVQAPRWDEESFFADLRTNVDCAKPSESSSLDYPSTVRSGVLALGTLVWREPKLDKVFGTCR
jgi:hypothetical protein